jgi:xanthine dehydrogenase accessory factor
MSSAAWVDAALRMLEREENIVRVVVAETRGSAPREAGAALLLGAKSNWGSIGGGRLEWEALTEAQRLLDDALTPQVLLREFVLGPQLNQCCGGRVTLWIERMTQAAIGDLRRLARELAVHRVVRCGTTWDAGGVRRAIEQPVVATHDLILERRQPYARLHEMLRGDELSVQLFGAGHVGQAIVHLLQDLPGFKLQWIDARDEVPLSRKNLPAYQRHIDPVAAVHAAPAGALVLVMTHDHALDYELCKAVLERNDAAWLGLIASASKAARFRSRLAREGLGPQAARLLQAPIGLPGITGKAPGVIAVSVVAQLLTLASSARERMAPPLVAATLHAPCGATACAGCAAPLVALA